MLLTIALVLMLGLCCSCDKDNDSRNDNPIVSEKFYPLDAPFILCIGQNPGGIIFDFIYKDKKGGANYYDFPSVKDLKPDLKIKNIRCKLPEGVSGGGGMPHMRLCNGAKAVNYTAICPGCHGFTEYEKLNKSDLKELSFKEDDPNFDISKLELTDWGIPSYEDVIKEFEKLVIGNIWKETAHNEIKNDELVWIIKTTEGRLVKMIVTQFPAKNGEKVLNGNIAMEWDLLD